MSRVSALLSGAEQQLLRYLAASRSQQSLHALRLSSGQRISTPSQDPAAFLHIAALESELSGVNQAISQVAAASDFAADAQLIIDQVRTQLDLIREILAEDEGGDLTPAQRAANQIEIDAALEAINALASTEVGGSNAFDGQSLSLTFALTTDPRQLSSLSLAALTTADLGDEDSHLSDLATGRSLAGLGSNTADALDFVDAALAQLDLVEATVDSFADITVARSADLLAGLQTNLEEALETINGIDEDEENQWIAYYEALSENAVSSLALITDQRQSIVSLLRSIAGLA